ncbi:hypothetical protein BKA70DRAFT_1562562 [Coprinopsis sp. MPI-PUGE-AT-0042]|nr:hypothetical protein BKA70DRAFT_1562562 [Coprinopsis sp. MPI-PUGE-AT-0042]
MPSQYSPRGSHYDEQVAAYTDSPQSRASILSNSSNSTVSSNAPSDYGFATHWNPARDSPRSHDDRDIKASSAHVTRPVTARPPTAVAPQQSAAFIPTLPATFAGILNTSVTFGSRTVRPFDFRLSPVLPPPSAYGIDVRQPVFCTPIYHIKLAFERFPDDWFMPINCPHGQPLTVYDLLSWIHTFLYTDVRRFQTASVPAHIVQNAATFNRARVNQQRQMSPVSVIDFQAACGLSAVFYGLSPSLKAKDTWTVHFEPTSLT